MGSTLEPGAAYMAREDYLDLMTRTEPAETPLFTLLPNEKELGGTTFDWAVDKWPDPVGARGVADGQDVSPGTLGANLLNNAENRRRMANYGQGFRKAFGVGQWQQKIVRTPGVSSEIDKASADMLVVHKQDIEAGLGAGDQIASTDGGADDGSVFAGLGALTSRTNTYAGTTHTVGKVPDSFVPPALAMEGDTVGDGTVVEGAALGTLNLTLLKSVVKALRGVVKRNRDYWLLCGPDLREAITGLTDPAVIAGPGASTQIRTFTQQIKDAELGASIDVVRTDFGRLLVVLTDWIGTTSTSNGVDYTATKSARVFTQKPRWGYVLARDMLAKRWGQMPEREDLPKMAGGPKAVWQSYCSLIVKHPGCHGRLFMSA